MPWKRKIPLHLKIRGLHHCVNSDFDTNTKKGEKLDDSAVEAILNVLDDAIAEKVYCCLTAAEIWVRLLSIYENQSSCNLSKLLDEYHTLGKTNEMKIEDHLGKVQALANQISELGRKQSKENEMLSGLPGCYNSFRSAWDSASEEKQTKEELVYRL